MTVGGVLIDIDDTLLDTRGAFRCAVLGLLDRWLPDLGGAAREEAVLHWALDPGGHFRAYTRGELDLAAQRRLRAVDLHRTFGGPELGEPELELWVEDYEARFRAAWRLAPDALGLVERLEALGLPMGSVTNADRVHQDAELTAVG